MLPLFYLFRSRAGREFWLCVFTTHGRATQVFLPDEGCLIYDHSPHIARRVLDALLPVVATAKAALARDVPVDHATTVGLLDLQRNFGHQLIDHLSGLQRLADAALLGRLDEIWLCGVEFFGPTEELFPETRGRVRRFPHRWEVSRELLRRPRARLFKIGSNVFQERLRARILRMCPAVPAAPGGSGPHLAVTVRPEGRRCVNLPEMVAGVVRRLLPAFPGLRVVLDGWVFPEAELVAASSVASAVVGPYAKQIRDELALAKAVADALPPGTVAGNLIGLSIRESLARLGGIDAYLAHVGTLQHKLGFFSAGRAASCTGPPRSCARPRGVRSSRRRGAPRCSSRRTPWRTSPWRPDAARASTTTPSATSTPWRTGCGGSWRSACRPGRRRFG
jgi:hypothetical protein